MRKKWGWIFRRSEVKGGIGNNCGAVGRDKIFVSLSTMINFHVFLLPRFRFDTEAKEKKFAGDKSIVSSLTKRPLLISRAKKQVEGRFRVTEKKSFVWFVIVRLWIASLSHAVALVYIYIHISLKLSKKDIYLSLMRK